MSHNYYLYEKLAEAHRQDLLREAEQQRRLSGLPKDHRSGMRRPTVKRAILVLASVLVLVFFGLFLVHSMMGFGLYPLAYHWDPQAYRYDPQGWSGHLAAVYSHLHVATVYLVA